MRKLLGLLQAPLLLSLLSVPAFAQATGKTTVEVCPKGSTFTKLCEISATNLPNYIGVIISLLLGIAVIIALFFLIWGGIKWILSGGDKSAVEAARNTIVAAIIGLAITFLAFFILTVIGQIFGIPLLRFEIPSLL